MVINNYFQGENMENIKLFDQYEYNRRIKQLYKIHDGGGLFNIDKLEDLIRDILEDKFEIEMQLEQCRQELYNSDCECC